MKKNKVKNYKWLVALFIVALIVILMVLIGFSKDSKINTTLNLTEKKWIENNKKRVINVSIANDIPVFSNEGKGIFFDYINELETKTGLTFNLISYDPNSTLKQNDLYFEVVKQGNYSNVKENDMLFYNDYYVLVGKKEEKINEPSDVINKKIGVLNDDLSNVSYFVTSENGVNYSPYKTADEIKNALTNGDVDYIAVPKTRYLNFILSNNYHIVYNITEMKEAYVLKTSSSVDRNLTSIVNKNYIDYKTNLLDEKYNESFFNLLLSENNISEKQKADFLGKEYVFGYLENEPYTNVINNRLIGLDSTFINLFNSVTGASFDIKKYRSVEDLTKGLNEGRVDIAPNYYNYQGLSGDYVTTISPYDEQYVVLVGKERTDIVVNSVKSLKGKEVISVNSTLSKFLETKGNAKVKTYDNISTLISKMNKEDIIVLDKNIYEMYKDSNLSDYRVIYNDKENLQYGYILRKANENNTFVDLITTYMEISNYKQIHNIAWKDYSADSKEVSHIYIYLFVILLVLLILWAIFRRKIKIKRKNKREETIRYIDPLTSLKNRNYLNKNFASWENNSIYPQAIIVINLNNLRHVNDVYGHEEGDKLIKLAANVLIRNQLDQSDIIRTDGNEYLIYMVGYEKNKVVTYMRKLYKELGELPYGYGATLGYSMIEDDIKSIDDAINEAVLEIRANKEMNNNRNK